MEISLKNDVTEKLVTAAWQNLLAKNCRLQTESGQSLKVIYPGKISDVPGSDFQDAVIKVDRHTYKGNIEVHVNSSDWRRHGHHLNPAYNGIVLHVALRRDYRGKITSQNGEVIPAVTIDRYETAEKVLSPFEKEGLRGIIELKFLLISL